MGTQDRLMPGRSIWILCVGWLLLPGVARARTLACDPTVSASSDDPQPAADASRATPSDEGQEIKEKKKKKADKQAVQAESGVSLHAGKHPGLSIGSAVNIEFKARLESDWRTATPAIGLDDAQQSWNDRRIGIEGTAFKKIEFEVARELGTDYETINGLSEKTAWRDVYVNAKLTKPFEVEAGRFKLPFGREELIGETNRDFIYRSLPTRVLAPGRDTGAMVHGRIAGRRLGYQAGYFTRDGDNGRTSRTEGGRSSLAGRFVVRPFDQTTLGALAPLEVGAAFATSQLDDRLGLRGRSVLGDSIFFDRVGVNGRRRRTGIEAAWAKGPVSMSTEYLSVSDQRTGMGFDGEDLPDTHASGWYVAGTWTVTGESKRGRVEPRRDVFDHGWGAVEAVGRVETLRFDALTYPGSDFGFPNASSLGANADHVSTVGVNWYLNHYVKLQTNVIVEKIDDPQRSPAPTTNGRFVTGLFRVQFAL
jgi:phosphate-selective porin OprO/OprP